MKRILLMAAVAALICVPVFAQAAAQGDQPAVKPAAVAPAVAAKDPEAKPAQKDMKLAQGPGQSKVTEDARHCLELASNTEVIKCAEPYLLVKQKKM